MTETLIEESLIGWKEFETEVMRDAGFECIREIGVETGGTKILDGVFDPKDRLLAREKREPAPNSARAAGRALIHIPRVGSRCGTYSHKRICSAP